MILCRHCYLIRNEWNKCGDHIAKNNSLFGIAGIENQNFVRNHRKCHLRDEWLDTYVVAWLYNVTFGHSV